MQPSLVDPTDMELAGKAASAIRAALPETRRIWLFGSRARGDARPDSDFDILFTVDSDRRAVELDCDARMALTDLTLAYLVPFDVFSMRDDEMHPGNPDLNAVACSVLAEGVAI